MCLSLKDGELVKLYLSIATTLITLVFPNTSYAETSDEKIASRLYQRLTGVPLMPENGRRAAMIALVSKKDLLGAAKVVTNRESGASEFYDVTLAEFASALNSGEQLDGVWNELVAMVVGNTRDDFPVDELLMGDFTYADPTAIGANAYSQTNNNHYSQQLQRSGSLRTSIQRMERPTFPGVGIFTSRPWGIGYLQAGTNRRNVVGIMQNLYCQTMNGMKNVNVPDTFIRRDVTRSTDSDPLIFQNDCKGCHGWMDPMSHAFAFFDYSDNQNQVIKTVQVGGKMNVNPNAFPAGYAVSSDQWNLTVHADQNKVLGFANPRQSGYGLKDLGKAIADSSGFHRCMVQRVANQVFLKKVFTLSGFTETDRKRLAAEQVRLDSLAESFGRHRNLKTLFEEAAVAFLNLGE